MRGKVITWDKEEKTLPMQTVYVKLYAEMDIKDTNSVFLREAAFQVI